MLRNQLNQKFKLIVETEGMLYTLTKHLPSPSLGLLYNKKYIIKDHNGCRSSLDHRQGSSMSRSSIFDGISSRFSQRFDGLSGPLSQRFDGISGPLSQRFDHNNNHDDDVIVEIEESSTSQSEVNLDSSPVLLSSSVQGRLPYYRSYSTGDLMIYMARLNSCTLSSSLLKESSPKSDYRTILNKQHDNWGSISSKSDRFVDYSSLSSTYIRV